MAGVISEGYLSRPFTLAKLAGRELIYDITNTDDETEVENLLLATAPAAYNGLEIESIQAEHISTNVWKGHAKYLRIENTDEYTFDTGGGTTKITQSISTVASYGIFGLTPPNYKGAIGVSDDKVEGVDIHTPTFTFSETHRFSDTFVLAGYKLVLFQLTNKVNNASFKGLNMGECLFLGASGTKRGDELWSITYKFEGSQNATGLVVGDITGINKRGWEYLWMRYVDFHDTSANAIVKRPEAAYVEQVYQYGDFSLLGIGT